MNNEIPVSFSCADNQLIGIVHTADTAAAVGVLLIVGGPQYRVGSHRQFVLLARALASKGIPVMRFDYTGMGDSTGGAKTFLSVDQDISAAMACFYQTCPNLKNIVLWGLCDAASAALFYAYQDERVNGLVLLNPWVYTEQGSAKTYLKHYYLQRLLSKDFWKKIISFQFNYQQSIDSLVDLIKKGFGGSAQNNAPLKTNLNSQKSFLVGNSLALPVRLRECLKRFRHPVLLILSGNDLTAGEFKEAVVADPDWQQLLSQDRLLRVDISEADHTFSTQIWRNQVAETTLNWMQNAHN